MTRDRLRSHGRVRHAVTGRRPRLKQNTDTAEDQTAVPPTPRTCHGRLTPGPGILSPAPVMSLPGVRIPIALLSVGALWAAALAFGLSRLRAYEFAPDAAAAAPAAWPAEVDLAR